MDFPAGEWRRYLGSNVDTGAVLQLDEYSNKLAHFLLSAGFQHGDAVALFMENRPEYIGLWLGCTKIGVVPALINSNLRGKSLMHSIAAASSTAVIFGSELTGAMAEIQTELSTDIRLFSSGRPLNCIRLGRAEYLDQARQLHKLQSGI